MAPLPEPFAHTNTSTPKPAMFISSEFKRCYDLPVEACTMAVEVFAKVASGCLLRCSSGCAHRGALRDGSGGNSETGLLTTANMA